MLRSRYSSVKEVSFDGSRRWAIWCRRDGCMFGRGDLLLSRLNLLVDTAGHTREHGPICGMCGQE